MSNIPNFCYKFEIFSYPDQMCPQNDKFFWYDWYEKNMCRNNGQER